MNAAWPPSAIPASGSGSWRARARLAQLAAVEVLAAGVVLRQNPERLARLQRDTESVRGDRVRHRIGAAEDTHDAQGNQALRTRR